AEPFEAVRKVELEILLELFLLGVGQNAVEQPFAVVRSEFRKLRRRKPPVDAQHRGQAHAHVQVRRAALDRHAHQFVHPQSEEIAYVCGHSSARSCCIFERTRGAAKGKTLPFLLYCIGTSPTLPHDARPAARKCPEGKEAQAPLSSRRSVRRARACK